MKQLKIKIFVTLSSFLLSIVTYSQNPDKIEEHPEIPAAFKGNKNEMLYLLIENICITKERAKTLDKDAIQKIRFKFLVENDGSVSEILIYSPIFENTSGLNQKLLTVYKTYPSSFYAAQKDGVGVRSFFHAMVNMESGTLNICDKNEESKLYSSSFQDQMDTKTKSFVNKTALTKYVYIKYLDPITKAIVTDNFKLKAGTETSEIDFYGKNIVKQEQVIDVKYNETENFYYQTFDAKVNQVSDEDWKEIPTDCKRVVFLKDKTTFVK